MEWSFDNSGIDVDDELWVVNVLPIDGRGENVQRIIGLSDMTFLKLASLVCSVGYNKKDTIYYQCGGLVGMELLDSNKKVTAMVNQYKGIKMLNLSILRRPAPTRRKKRTRKKALLVEQPTKEGINQVIVEQENGVEEKGKAAEEEEETAVAEEIEEIAVAENYDDEDLENLAQLKRRKEDPTEHMEGDTDIEDLYPLLDDASVTTLDSCNPSKKRAEAWKKKKQRKDAILSSLAKSRDGTNTQACELSDAGSEDIGMDIIPSDDDGFEPAISVAPKCKKSRAQPLPTRVWYDEGRFLGGEQLCLHMCFVNMHQYRRALKNYHILQSRDYMYLRNDRDRVNVCCVNEHCQFYMTASAIKREETVCIRKMVLPHTCGITYATSRVDSTWLSNKYENNFRGDPDWKISALIDTTKRNHGVDITPMMAYRARNKAADIVLGNHKQQYVRIRDYLQTVLDTNPGSRCIVTTVQQPPPAMNPRFHGLFFCVNAAKEGFLHGCRPFIGVDGCFVKLTTGAQVLAASGRDGNNNLFPIAFGVVGKEDIPNWCWFLEQLKYALGGDSGPFGRWTIMSDRQKGLLNAIDKVFPNCDQRYCLRHIYANFQTAGHKGGDLKKHMDSAAYAYQKSDYEAAMSDMKAESESAWEWLSKIPPRHWARHAMDTNCKTDLVVNNLSEVFNKYILETRDKPIQTMIDNIRTKLMVRYNSNREGLANSNWELTRNYAEKLELEKTRAKHCRPVCAGKGLWQVTSGLKTYVVNVDANTCGCRRWDINGVPCKHAVSCIYKKKEHPEDYMSAFFKRPMYQVAYNNIIYPVPSKDSWAKTETPDIDPPIFTRHPGRPKKSRRKGVHEVPQPGSRHRMTTTTCSNCHKPGHKYTNCSTPLRADLAIRKNKHKSNRRIFQEGPIHAQAEATAVYVQAEATPVHVQAEATPVHVQAEATPVHVQDDTTTGAAGRGQAEAAIQDPFHAHAVFQAHDPFYGFDIQEVASQPTAANSGEKLPVMRGSGSAGGKGKFMEYFTASGNY
ncbi:hypothetical protein ACQJBY_022378 [Aegilops geniculata]